MHYYCEIMYFRPVILVTITEVKNVIKVSESELKKLTNGIKFLIQRA